MPPFVDGMGPDEMEAAASDGGSYSEDDDDPDSTWRSSVVYLFTWWVPPIKRLFVRPRKRVDFEAAVVAANEPSAAPAIASPQVAISINPQFNPPVAEPQRHQQERGRCSGRAADRCCRSRTIIAGRSSVGNRGGRRGRGR